MTIRCLVKYVSIIILPSIKKLLFLLVVANKRQSYLLFIKNVLDYIFLYFKGKGLSRRAKQVL